jgi:hypothetical protein
VSTPDGVKMRPHVVTLFPPMPLVMVRVARTAVGAIQPTPRGQARRVEGIRLSAPAARHVDPAAAVDRHPAGKPRLRDPRAVEERDLHVPPGSKRAKRTPPPGQAERARGPMPPVWCPIPPM